MVMLSDTNSLHTISDIRLNTRNLNVPFEESLRALKASRLMNKENFQARLSLTVLTQPFTLLTHSNKWNFAERRFQGNVLALSIDSPNISSFSTLNKKSDKLHTCVKVLGNYKPARRLIGKQISICMILNGGGLDLSRVSWRITARSTHDEIHWPVHRLNFWQCCRHE